MTNNRFKMETQLNEYYYNKGKVTAKAVTYTVVSVLLVAFGVFCFVHWELGFMFSDWKGWVMIGVYGLVTLGCILSAAEDFKKVVKAGRGIPAFGAGPDCFVVYDKHGLATKIPFDDCERVRFKLEHWLHASIHILTLIVVYHDNAVPPGTKRIEIPLNELDTPQREIDRRLKKIYHNYKNAHKAPESPVDE